MQMPKFDSTIKLSDILVALTVAGAAFGLYGKLDNRVIVLETASAYQHLIDAAQDKRSDELKADLLGALKDVHTSVDRLGDRIDTTRTK